MEGTAGASAARLGGREGRSSRRLGFLGKRSSPGTWLLPRSLPLRAPLAPCFHPPESLRCRIAEQPPQLATASQRHHDRPRRRSGPRRRLRRRRPGESRARARARVPACPRARAPALGTDRARSVEHRPPRSVEPAAPRPPRETGETSAVGGSSSPGGGGRAVPRARPPARPPPAPVEVARRHQRTSTDSPHGPAALRLRRPARALCSRGRLSRTSPVCAAPTPRAAPRARPVVDRGPAQRASGGSRNPNNAGTGAGHGGRAGGAGLRHHAGPPLPATPVVPPDIIDAQT